MFFRKKKQIPYTPQFNEIGIGTQGLPDVVVRNMWDFAQIPGITDHEIIRLAKLDMIIDSLNGRKGLSDQELDDFAEAVSTKVNLLNEIKQRSQSK